MQPKVDKCCQEVKALLMTDLEKNEETNNISKCTESEILDIPALSTPEEESTKLPPRFCLRLFAVSRPMKYPHFLLTEHRGMTHQGSPYQSVSAEYLPPSLVSLPLGFLLRPFQ